MSGDQLLWVIVATAVTVVLRWAANRWPDKPPPRRRAKPKPKPVPEEE